MGSSLIFALRHTVKLAKDNNEKNKTSKEVLKCFPSKRKHLAVR